MNLNKQTSGLQLNAADMKKIKGAWGGWGQGCHTGGYCTDAADCEVFPSGCFSFSPITVECFNNNCILLDGNLL